jgi:hypothetical protein
MVHIVQSYLRLAGGQPSDGRGFQQVEIVQGTCAGESSRAHAADGAHEAHGDVLQNGTECRFHSRFLGPTLCTIESTEPT